MIRVRYARFNAGLIASMVYNARLPEEPVTPFDFIPGFEDEEAKEAARVRRALQVDVKRALMRESTSSPERVKAVTRGLINMLRDNGIEDPEDLILEVFPEMEI